MTTIHQVTKLKAIAAGAVDTVRAMQLTYAQMCIRYPTECHLDTLAKLHDLQMRAVIACKVADTAARRVISRPAQSTAGTPADLERALRISSTALLRKCRGMFT